MKKKIENKIKSRDLFSYQPSFNINNNSKNPKHHTIIGGCTTIILLICVFVFVIAKLK